ncbi:MAG: hypothetical protein K2X39_02375 [Silvanigrellaceae bacterium]|nr:hypothetical protein [Silvanigrellaceae bacterium]
MRRVDFLVLLYFGVIFSAVGVIALRSNTISIGYDIAKTKQKELQLKQTQLELQAELASLEKSIRETMLFKKENDKFILPEANNVIRKKTD